MFFLILLYIVLICLAELQTLWWRSEPLLLARTAELALMIRVPQSGETN